MSFPFRKSWRHCSYSQVVAPRIAERLPSHRRRVVGAALSLWCAVALTGCGGGSDSSGPPAASSPPPAPPGAGGPAAGGPMAGGPAAGPMAGGPPGRPGMGAPDAANGGPMGGPMAGGPGPMAGGPAAGPMAGGPAAGPGAFPGGPGYDPAAQQNAAPQEPPRPEQVADWTPDDFRSALKQRDPRLIEAVNSYVEANPKDPEVVALLVELLETIPTLASAQSNAPGYPPVYGQTPIGVDPYADESGATRFPAANRAGPLPQGPAAGAGLDPGRGAPGGPESFPAKGAPGQPPAPGPAAGGPSPGGPVPGSPIPPGRGAPGQPGGAQQYAPPKFQPQFFQLRRNADNVHDQLAQAEPGRGAPPGGPSPNGPRPGAAPPQDILPGRGPAGAPQPGGPSPDGVRPGAVPPQDVLPGRGAPLPGGPAAGPGPGGPAVGPGPGGFPASGPGPGAFPGAPGAYPGAPGGFGGSQMGNLSVEELGFTILDAFATIDTSESWKALQRVIDGELETGLNVERIVDHLANILIHNYGGEEHPTHEIMEAIRNARMTRRANNGLHDAIGVQIATKTLALIPAVMDQLMRPETSAAPRSANPQNNAVAGAGAAFPFGAPAANAPGANAPGGPFPFSPAAGGPPAGGPAGDRAAFGGPQAGGPAAGGPFAGREGPGAYPPGPGGPAAGGPAAGGPGAYGPGVGGPGAMGPGGFGQGYQQSSLSIPEEKLKNVTRLIWSDLFLDTITASLLAETQLLTLEERLSLAASMPFDSVRGAIHHNLNTHWAEAAEGGPTTFVNDARDPGLLVVLKLLPKSNPSAGSGSGGSNKAASERAAKQHWFTVAQNAARKFADQMYAAALANPGTNRDDTPSPIRLHNNANITAEYLMRWPADVSDRVGDIQVSPLIVHYIRVHLSSEEAGNKEILNHYKGALARKDSYDVSGGKWYDIMQAGETPTHKRSVDVFFSAASGGAGGAGGPAAGGPAAGGPGAGAAGRGAGGPGAGGGGGSDYVIEILSIEIDNPRVRTTNAPSETKSDEEEASEPSTEEEEE